MGSVGGMVEVDLIEELRLRRWARENYVAQGRREKSWHPIVHDEMSRKDREELQADISYFARAKR